MARFRKFIPQGVIPAALLPFNADFSIDGASFKLHLADLASVRGVSAITINAHSTEVSSCSFDDQRLVLDLALEAVGDRTPLVNGIYADGSMEAARLARMAHDAGASCLLIFPPNIYRNGQRPEMALEHFRRIAGETDLPLILFQYAVSAGGQCYPLETITRIAEAVPSLMAIKDGCASPQLHERHIRTLQSLARPINVLSTHSAWLFSSLVQGCNGLLSGSGSVTACIRYVRNSGCISRKVASIGPRIAFAINDIHPFAVSTECKVVRFISRWNQIGHGPCVASSQWYDGNGVCPCIDCVQHAAVAGKCYVECGDSGVL